MSAVESPSPAEKSYGRMLKTSALMGGSSAFNIGLGILRTKILAVQLGPELFGVMGLYVTLTQMISGIASLGIGQSAVREIAVAAGSEDPLRVARTIRAYRRAVIVTGIAGLLITLALAYPASFITFHNGEHVWAIATLSVVVLCSQIQAGQSALLQGLRRFKDLAALNITGGIWSTLLAIPILLYFEQRGIVLFLVAVAVGQAIASWWYARGVHVEPVEISWSETWSISKSMLALGFAFLVNGVGISVALYVIRLIINAYQGEAAVGLYQSAFTFSTLYVGFVLQAMGSDYYPRLAGLGADVEKQNQLVNEQAKLAILLATPGLVASLFLSDLLIWAMYSSRFAGAADILRWLVLGLLGRIISSPISLILIARSDSRAALFLELTSMILHVGLVWLGVSWIGVEGAGIAFAIASGFYCIVAYWLVRTRKGYVYSSSTRNTLVAGVSAVVLAFAATFITSFGWRVGAGVLLLAVSSFFCIEQLATLVPSSRPARWWRMLRGIPQPAPSKPGN